MATGTIESRVLGPGGLSGANIIGPASSTNRAIATWDGTSGTALFDNSTVTISSGGVLSLTSAAQLGQIVLRPSASTFDSGGIQFLNPASSGRTNFYIGNGAVSSNEFEIIPSTASDGTTFTTPIFKATSSGTIVLNSAAIATTATNGFLYIASCAGTPTGVPTSFSGRFPIVYDSTANKIWFYNGSWRGVVVA